MTFLALLLLKCRHYLAYGFLPYCIEDGLVTALLPVFIRKADRVAVRVNLPFTLEDVWICLRPVGLIMCADRLNIECIGIRIDAYAFELPADHAGNHLPEFGILVYISQIRPYLRSRVAEPHCRDVTGVYERVRLTVFAFDRMDSSVKSVGIAVCEHPLQARILQHSYNSCDLLLYCL